MKVATSTPIAIRGTATPMPILLPVLTPGLEGEEGVEALVLLELVVDTGMEDRLEDVVNELGSFVVETVAAVPILKYWLFDARPRGTWNSFFNFI